MAQLNATQKKIIKDYVKSQVLPEDQQYYGSGKFKGGYISIPFIPEEILVKLEKIKYNETLRADAFRYMGDLCAEIAYKKN